MSFASTLFSFFFLVWTALTTLVNPLDTSPVDHAAMTSLAWPLFKVENASDTRYADLTFLNDTSSPGDTTSTDISQATSSQTTVTSEIDLAEAIVNIYCVQKTDTYRRTVSGTGFFISERGVVLTNAHVGQFLLLEKAVDMGETNCYIKTGEKAEAAYEIDILYLSPTWLLAHADLISDPAPRGSGENDFALLYVTKSVNDTPLPEKFPFLPPTTSPLTAKFRNSTVILVGYPSTDLSSGLRVTATSTVTNIYTFQTGYADILTLSSSALGHEGASGGPVIDHLGRAIGVISTKDEGTTNLNAITLPHIDRAIKKETGFDLMSTIQGDLGSRAALFNRTVAPILQNLLTNNLR